MPHSVVIISVLAAQCLLAGLIYFLTSRACRGKNKPLLLRVGANVIACLLFLVAGWLGGMLLFSPILGGAIGFFSFVPCVIFWLRIID